MLSRRWIGFAIFVAVLSAICIQLGMWQFHRLGARLDNNKIVTSHFNTAPVPIQDVLLPSRDPSKDDEWTRVTATGTYDLNHQITVKYKTRDSVAGVDVVTPLVLDSGAAVLIDRGWMESDNNTQQVTDVPPPPPGTVTVSGWLRLNNGATGQPVTPSDGQVRAISTKGVQSTVPYKLYSGYINALSQDPEPTTKLAAEPVPELGQGPHFFYALQWMFFAGLAIFGWFYFAWVEAHPKKRKRPEESLEEISR